MCIVKCVKEQSNKACPESYETLCIVSFLKSDDTQKNNKMFILTKVSVHCCLFVTEQLHLFYNFFLISIVRVDSIILAQVIQFRTHLLQNLELNA